MEELLHTFQILIAFILIAATLALILIFLFKIKGERRRKLLHIIAFMTVPVMCFATDKWYIVSLVALLFAIIVYPILVLFEKFPVYKNIFQERKTGEIKTSLLLLFGTEALLTAIFWGCFDSEQTVILSILIWGSGDMAAALIGKKYGKHKLPKKISDGKKSYEGSIAMFVTDLLIGITIMYLYGNISIVTIVLASLIATITEAITKDGYDTVTVPFATAAIIQIMLIIGL